MSAIPLHPILVHVPMALAVLMPLLFAGVVVAWWRQRLPRSAWWIAVAMQGALLVSGIAAMSSGEAEEEVVERVVPEPALERHEEAAMPFLIGGGAVLGLALAAGLWRDEPTAKRIAVVAALGTLGVLALGYRVGEAGGELVYRHHAGAAYSDAAPSSPSSGASVDDD